MILLVGLNVLMGIIWMMRGANFARKAAVVVVQVIFVMVVRVAIN
jgi:hypothetical protein